MGWFLEWKKLEVDHENIKVRLFTQSLVGEERKCFTNLLNNSILNYQALEYSFKNKWEDKKDPRKCLSNFHFMKRRESEFVQEFSHRFLKAYNAILS